MYKMSIGEILKYHCKLGMGQEEQRTAHGNLCALPVLAVKLPPPPGRPPWFLLPSFDYAEWPPWTPGDQPPQA